MRYVFNYIYFKVCGGILTACCLGYLNSDVELLIGIGQRVHDLGQEFYVNLVMSN